MTALSLASSLVLYVLLLVRSRKNPLFIAGGAAFLALGRSTYIDIVPDQILRRVGPLFVTTGDLVCAALVLGWMYARRSRPHPRVRLPARWTVLGLCIAYFLALEMALSLTDAGGLQPSLVLATRDWFYIPIGFLVTLDILRRFELEEVTEYVGGLSLVTTLLMGLYIGSALGKHVYPYSKYLTTSVGGTTIIRDFSTFPIWLGIAWSYYLMRARTNVWVLAALAVLAAGTLLSYTRSLILGLAAVAILAVILQLVQRERRSRGLTLAVAAGILVAFFLIGGPVLAPAQYGYLQARISSSQGSATLQDPNLKYRIALFRDAQKDGASVDKALGAGFVSRPAALHPQGYNSYDSDWIRIVYATGWAGVIMLSLPLLLSVFWGLGAFMRLRGSPEMSSLLLIGLLATIFSIDARFTGITYFWWPAIALVPQALVAYGGAIPIAQRVAVPSRPAQVQGLPWLGSAT